MSNAEVAITRLIHASAHYLDQHNFDAYVDLFADDGEYVMVTLAPELPKPMTWMQRSKTELAERFDAAPKHEWQIMQQDQTRLISVNLLEVRNDTASSISNFVVYNTDEQGRSSCFAVGCYEDSWSMEDEKWLMLQRKVVLKTRLLSSPSALPL
jgi:3-phenylpropionate/cinnamic acid dioxygenase small subunit